MARPLRIHFPGAIYHVSSRMLGNWRSERNLLFRTDEYLLKLSRYVHQNPVAVAAWKNRSIEERIIRLSSALAPDVVFRLWLNSMEFR